MPSKQPTIDLAVAFRAGEILSLVHADLERAYARDITRRIQAARASFRPERTFLENEVGAALRFLQKLGLLSSQKDGSIRRYELTMLGAFMMSLAERSSSVTLKTA